MGVFVDAPGLIGKRRTTQLLGHVIQESGCWDWVGTLQRNGYAAITNRSKKHMVHRYYYEFYRGPIPNGLHIDHLCRNRICVNPEHLEAVTQAENNRRAGKKGTNCKRCGTPYSWGVHGEPGSVCVPCKNRRNRDSRRRRLAGS